MAPDALIKTWLVEVPSLSPDPLKKDQFTSLPAPLEIELQPNAPANQVRAFEALSQAVNPAPVKLFPTDRLVVVALVVVAYSEVRLVIVDEALTTAPAIWAKAAEVIG